MSKKRKDDIMDKLTDNVNDPIVVEAAKLAQREYHRKWKRENKEKVRIYQERYWAKKALAAVVADGQAERR